MTATPSDDDVFRALGSANPADRVSPFATGSEFGEWTAQNCGRCRLGAPTPPTCPGEQALAFAYMSDGTWPRDLATRYGFTEHAAPATCAAFVPAVPPRPHVVAPPRRVSLEDHAVAVKAGAPADWHRRYAAPPGTGPSGRTCSSCRNLVTTDSRGRHAKCALVDFTHGDATSIKRQASACRLFEEDTRS